MDLHSGIIPTLSYALGSVRRFRERSPHRETVQFWHELLNEAQEAKRRCSSFESRAARELDELIAAMDEELDRLPKPRMPDRLLRLDPI